MTDKMIDLLILYVTHRCNSRCKTCFFWKNLNSNGQELTLEELERISKSIGPFTNLLLGGGEPTLRKDILDIAELFYKNNKVRDISMPTNCLLPERVIEIAEGLLKRCPNAIINLGLSLDGTEEVHDSIRGVKGNFQKVLVVEKRLRPFASNKQLLVKILTTVTKDNYDNLPELMAFVKNTMKVKWHYFEPIRGNPKDISQKGLTYPQIRALNKKVLKNYTHYYKTGLGNRLRMYYDLYNIRASQSNTEQFFKDGTMKLGCTAGTSAAVIEPTGDVKLCELLEPIGNIRSSGYDFRRLWNSEKAKEQRGFIKGKNCSCTHCVFMEKNTFAKVVEFLRWKRV